MLKAYIRVQNTKFYEDVCIGIYHVLHLHVPGLFTVYSQIHQRVKDMASNIERWWRGEFLRQEEPPRSFSDRKFIAVLVCLYYCCLAMGVVILFVISNGIADLHRQEEDQHSEGLGKK